MKTKELCHTVLTDDFLACPVTPQGDRGRRSAASVPHAFGRNRRIVRWPRVEWVSLPLLTREHDFSPTGGSRLQIFLYVQASNLLASQIVPTAAHTPQGGRGFDIRAERASLPPHAPNRLTVRIEAIDRRRTFNWQDSQPYRLPPTPTPSTPRHIFPSFYHQLHEGRRPLSEFRLAQGLARRLADGLLLPV